MKSDHPSASEHAQDEFMRLFSQHSRRIYQFILTLAMNHADAEEVYQNTCIVLWRKFDSYDPSGAFYAWACRIAQLELMQVRRKNNRMQTFSEDVLGLLADHAIAQVGQLGDQQDALADCLKKLRASDQRLIEQRYYHEQPPKEIARLQSSSVHSVYRALARVHMSLRDCIHRNLAREHA
jgi:RNA polymerase sigma-70 factor (ECF subfamily)